LELNLGEAEQLSCMDVVGKVSSGDRLSQGWILLSFALTANLSYFVTVCLSE
jgi:hypothetical protein